MCFNFGKCEILMNCSVFSIGIKETCISLYCLHIRILFIVYIYNNKDNKDNLIYNQVDYQ